MIIVHGTIPLKSGCRDQALALARTMVELTRSENGCISYDFYVALSNPDMLMLFQEWESMDALMAHFQTPHMDDFLKQLPELVDGEITTKRYAVQSMDDDQPVIEEPPPIIH
jgi:quinol monooxygenase YgiN